MKRIETIRLYPTSTQLRMLSFVLYVTRTLYNAALEERRDAYRRRHVLVTKKMQYAELTAFRKEWLPLAGVYRECLDAVLHRLDLAMQAAFRRLARGEKVGFPRFKAASRWNSIVFPHGNRALKLDDAQKRIRVPGLGSVKLRRGRPVPSFGRAWLVRKNGRWYAQFECERIAQPLAPTGAAVGIDRGITVLLATSSGDLIENPRFLEASRNHLARTQRKVSKKKRDGRNRRKAVRVLARRHEKVACQRRDYAHKVSRRIVDTYDRIALEDLRLLNMTRSAKGTVKEPGRNVAAKAGLNRAMLDASFGIIAQLIVEKAASAAREIAFVDPKYTSQTCSNCGHVASENRSGISFLCRGCQYAEHADVNAAKIILKRAQWGPLASRAAIADGEDPSTVPSLSEPQLTSQDAA